MPLKFLMTVLSSFALTTSFLSPLCASSKNLKDETPLENNEKKPVKTLVQKFEDKVRDDVKKVVKLEKDVEKKFKQEIEKIFPHGQHVSLLTVVEEEIKTVEGGVLNKIKLFEDMAKNLENKAKELEENVIKELKNDFSKTQNTIATHNDQLKKLTETQNKQITTLQKFENKIKEDAILVENKLKDLGKKAENEAITVKNDLVKDFKFLEGKVETIMSFIKGGGIQKVVGEGETVLKDSETIVKDSEIVISFIEKYGPLFLKIAKGTEKEQNALKSVFGYINEGLSKAEDAEAYLTGLFNKQETVVSNTTSTSNNNDTQIV